MEKKEFNQPEFFKPLFNWIVFLVVMTLSLLLLVYVLNSEFEEQNFKLLFLVMGIFFFVYGFQIDNGTRYLSDWYALFIKEKTLTECLSQIPLIFYLLYWIFSITSRPCSIFLTLSMSSFVFPMIMGLLVILHPLLKRIILRHKRKAGVRKR